MKIKMFRKWIWPATGVLINGEGTFRFVDLGPFQFIFRA